MLGRNLTHPATEESLPVLPYETARCPGMAVLLGSGYADEPFAAVKKLFGS